MMKPEINGVVINWQPIIIVLFISTFIFAGLAIIFIPIIRIKKLKKVCTTEVIATIIEYKITHNEGSELYCPVYGFEFNGKKFEVMNNTFSNAYIKPIGTMVDLRINPNNPEEFLDNTSIPILSIVIGTCFLLVSVPLLILVILNGNFIE